MSYYNDMDDIFENYRELLDGLKVINQIIIDKTFDVGKHTPNSRTHIYFYFHIDKNDYYEMGKNYFSKDNTSQVKWNPNKWELDEYSMWNKRITLKLVVKEN